jgi:uncharacterized protein (DUF427 family)
MKAIWNGLVIAESDDVIKLEGHYYFPEAAVKQEYLQESMHRYVCPWKGNANYYHLSAENKASEDAAWQYRNPTDAAKEIKGMIAFDNDVAILPS